MAKDRETARLRRTLAAAEKKVARASERRRAMPPSSSRARVTTANAKWATACEDRDRVLATLAEAEAGMEAEL
jgi:hypothetical protein